jgi:hypothetical protein
MTMRCTPGKSHPRAYPPLGNENRASLVGSFTRAGALACVHVADRVYHPSLIGKENHYSTLKKATRSVFSASVRPMANRAL